MESEQQYIARHIVFHWVYVPIYPHFRVHQFYSMWLVCSVKTRDWKYCSNMLIKLSFCSQLWVC